MKTNASRHAYHRPDLILRGVHLWLTDGMKNAISRRAERLFRHEPRIIRLRVDVGCDRSRTGRWFTAKGQLEMPGPDLNAAVTSDDGYLSINLLMGKLDRMIRRRMTTFLRRRTLGDIHAHPVGAARVVGPLQHPAPRDLNVTTETSSQLSF